MARNDGRDCALEHGGWLARWTLATTCLAAFALSAAVETPTAGPGTSGRRAEDQDGARPEAAKPDAPAVPPIQEPAFADEALGTDFRAARRRLDEGAYTDAKKLLGKWKGKGANADEESAIQRVLLEIDGRLELSGVEADIAKNKFRQALGKLDKMLPRFAKTFAGEAMAVRRGELYTTIFLVVDDFEPRNGAPSPSAGGPNSGGYGPNTKVVGKSTDASGVRRGENALRWRTGPGYSFISFPSVKEQAQDYRWLNLSLKTDDPKRRPQLAVFFDCLEGMGGFDGGPRGWEGLGRRQGYLMNVLPEGDWQDLRLDLGKFHPRGDAKWEEVVALRIVHVAGIEATIYVDEITLERE